MITSILNSQDIKAEAMRLGFSACGIAPATAIENNIACTFREWLREGGHAEMAYMKNHEEKRLNPRVLMEGASTIICVALNYYPKEKIPEEEYQIAWYAYGKDYHEVMKEKLKTLLNWISEKYDGTQGRYFCDTAPILERYWAERAGIGWIGKNTQLIIPHAGSCFFLGEIILNLPADTYDQKARNRCGTCKRCIEACPTQAISTPYKLKAERCISYLTIEYRGDLSLHTGLKMGKKIYGCDECQKVCPWNRFAKPCQTSELMPSPALLKMKQENWIQLSEDDYKILFKGSAVKRTKYKGLKRNIEKVKNGKSEKENTE